MEHYFYYLILSEDYFNFCMPLLRGLQMRAC